MAYLNRDVTTVQRWEKREGMPVHRHVHDKPGYVYVLAEDLDEWVQSRRLRVDAPEEKPEEEVALTSASVDSAMGAPGTYLRLVLATLAYIYLLAAAWLIFQRRNGYGRALDSVAGGAASAQPIRGFCAGLPGRWFHRGPYRASRRHPRSARDLSHLGDALQESAALRSGDRQNTRRRRCRRRLGYQRGRSHSRHGPADSGHNRHAFLSETYDREMRDVLNLEGELAQSIAQKVEVTVTGKERQRLVWARAVSSEVYETFLKGMSTLEKSADRADSERSVQYFEAAIREDPTFAPAYVGLAQAYQYLSTVYVGVRPDEMRPKIYRCYPQSTRTRSRVGRSARRPARRRTIAMAVV